MNARYASFLLLSSLLGPMVMAQSGCPSTVTDIDGNTYPVVQIGDRCWTARNLSTGHYANGDSIPTGLTGTEWEGLASGACTVYGALPVNETTYGRLYNWFAMVDFRGLCPEGWHASSDEDWLAMEQHLGMDPGELPLWNWRGTLANVGGKLKSTTGWVPPNTGATNSSGFTALPGGYAGYDQTFEFLTTWGQFWTTGQNEGDGIGRRLTSSESGIDRSYYIKQVGFSCRCVYDQLVSVEEEGALPTLRVFPNPAMDVVYVEHGPPASNFTLHDALGQVVLSGRLVEGVNTLDLSALAPGAYLLRTDDQPMGVRVVKW